MVEAVANVLHDAASLVLDGDRKRVKRATVRSVHAWYVFRTVHALPTPPHHTGLG